MQMNGNLQAVKRIQKYHEIITKMIHYFSSLLEPYNNLSDKGTYICKKKKNPNIVPRVNKFLDFFNESADGSS